MSIPLRVPHTSIALGEVFRPAPAITDRLSTLPPELLSIIFTYSGITAPISKGLLPYTRTNRFRVIDRSLHYKETRLLTKTLLDSSLSALPHAVPLGSLVRSLKLTVDDPVEEGQDKHIGEYTALFAMLSHLVTLDIHVKDDSSDLIDFILNNQKARTHFQHLKELSIIGPKSGSLDLMVSTNYTNLHHFPALIDLVIRYTDNHDVSSRAASSTGLAPNRTLKDLQLEISSHSYRAPRQVTLLSHFQALEYLYVFTWRVDENFRHLLANLSPSLQHLAVYSYQGYEPGRIELKIGRSTLYHLSNLYTLELGDGTYEPSGFDYLNEISPLEHLTLGATAPLDKYTALVKGTKAPKHFVIENDAWSELYMGWPLLTLDEISQVENEPANNGTEWALPIWTDAFSYEGTKQLIEIGEEKGVEITGTVHPAIHVQEMWEEAKAKFHLAVASGSI